MPCARDRSRLLGGLVEMLSHMQCLMENRMHGVVSLDKIAIAADQLFDFTCWKEPISSLYRERVEPGTGAF
jgi:hypothetical protein